MAASSRSPRFAASGNSRQAPGSRKLSTRRTEKRRDTWHVRKPSSRGQEVWRVTVDEVREGWSKRWLAGATLLGEERPARYDEADALLPACTDLSPPGVTVGPSAWRSLQAARKRARILCEVLAGGSAWLAVLVATFVSGCGPSSRCEQQCDRWRDDCDHHGFFDYGCDEACPLKEQCPTYSSCEADCYACLADYGRCGEVDGLVLTVEVRPECEQACDCRDERAEEFGCFED